MLALAAGAMTAQAQETPEAELPAEQIEAETLRRTKPSFGKYFEGYSRAIAYDRLIPPYDLEVTFDKTSHLIFPAPIVNGSFIERGTEPKAA